MQTTPSPAAESNASKQLRALFASGRPLLYIVSAEEQRVGRLLRVAARSFFREPVALWSWSLTGGMQCGDDAPLDSPTLTGASAPASLRYRRVLLKISGEALAGEVAAVDQHVEPGEHVGAAG